MLSILGFLLAAAGALVVLYFLYVIVVEIFVWVVKLIIGDK